VGDIDADSAIADTAIDASHHRLSAYPLRAWSIRSTTSNSFPAYMVFAAA
jgi:hypothetical protein